MDEFDLSNFYLKENLLYIKNLPLYWRVGPGNNDLNIPSNLDFTLFYDKKYGCARQKVSPLLNKTLNEIYQEHENIGYLREDNTLAIKYHTDLLNFILKNIPDISSKHVLEIGCGGCTILNELQKRNAKVLGIDPSPFAVECGSKYNIKIIDKFFEKDLISDPYDLTFFSDVLEHISDPISFLSDIESRLPDHSKIIVAVPDASTEHSTGDISMCMHQHITYFTKNSLTNTILKSGLNPIKIVSSGYGGSLYCLAEVKRSSEPNFYSIDGFNQNQLTEENYFKRIDNVIKKFREIVTDTLGKGRLFHCYCPLRALPYLAAIDQLSNQNVRFIDDTPYWNNGFIDGADTIIKPLKGSKIKENDIIFIFSNTFSNEIKHKLNSYGYSLNTIFSLSDLYD